MVKKEDELFDELKTKFKVDGYVQKERRLWISIDSKALLKICKQLKDRGFHHLSAISVTDWIKEKNYEITYHLWSYKEKILVTLKTKISRKNPSIESVSKIWNENAQIHEREMHELFGVKFNGNNDLSPLFLENWEGLPPFRKDFDWREYVKDKYYDKKNDREKAYYD